MPNVQGEVGNKLLTDDIIVKEALRRLKNNLVMAPLVYRDLEQKFAKVGDSINLELPYRTKTASGRVLQKQPLVDKSTPFVINRQEHFGVEVTTRARTLSIEKFSERYLQSGISQIANAIDRSILLQMRLAYFTSGDPGTKLSLKSFMYASAYMDSVAVPDDSLRRAVVNPLDAAEINVDMKELNNSGLVKTAVQRGYMGPLAGFDLFKSQNVPMHMTGSAVAETAIKVKGGGQTGDTLTIDGITNTSGSFNVGDVFTIDGVYAINPQNYESTGRLQRFVVTADSGGGGAQTLNISPAINDGSLTTTDAEGHTVSLAAYQNVSDAPADNAAVTFMGQANTEYRQDFLFHKDAVALAMVDLELPQSATVKSRVRDPESGLALSMTGAYDINQQTEITRIDGVWGAHMIYPHLAHRIWSDSAQ